MKEIIAVVKVRVKYRYDERQTNREHVLYEEFGQWETCELKDILDVTVEEENDIQDEREYGPEDEI